MLLAPKTGQLVGDLIVNGGKAERLSVKDQALLQAFSWERFTTPGGGKALAANARYAATFYPVHKRSSTGIAAAVGTELGFYEGAAAAKGDREKDRQAMFGLSAEDEDVLEKAAGMGIGDAEAFSFGDESDGWMKRSSSSSTSENEGIGMEKISAEPDALTVGVKEEDEYATLAQEWSDAQATNADDEDDVKDEEESTTTKSDLSSIYEKIKANKAKASESLEMGEDSSEEREDPGFRIYHVEKETRESREVPPFTSPGEFLQMIEGGSGPSSTNNQKEGVEDEAPLFDGYTAIIEAYGGRTTEEETAEATRSARMSNRVKASKIDESKIGAMISSEDSLLPASSPAADSTTNKYEKVRSEKAKAWVSELNGSTAEESIDENSLDDGSDEKTYDGYQAIMSVNSASSREEDLARMKEARMANRAKADRIDQAFKV